MCYFYKNIRKAGVGTFYTILTQTNSFLKIYNTFKAGFVLQKVSVSIYTNSKLNFQPSPETEFFRSIFTYLFLKPKTQLN